MKCCIPICNIPIQCFSFMPEIEDARMYLCIEGKTALVIDPSLSEEAFVLLKQAGVEDVTVLLTHEHYDHISGVNRLCSSFNCNVVCTEICAKLIQDPRKNLSQYYRPQHIMLVEKKQISAFAQIQPFSCHADTCFSGQMKLHFSHHTLVLTETPGHSRGSLCAALDDQIVFTGDSLIPHTPVVTKLPGESRQDYKIYTLPYLCSLPNDMWVLPGHFDGAPLKELLKEVKTYVTEG